MNMVQVYIKGQEDKELNSFFRYYPQSGIRKDCRYQQTGFCIWP